MPFKCSNMPSGRPICELKAISWRGYSIRYSSIPNLFSFQPPGCIDRFSRWWDSPSFLVARSVWKTCWQGRILGFSPEVMARPTINDQRDP